MGNPICHVELLTEDITKARKFYQDLFDWKFDDIPDKGYIAINLGAGLGGGMMKNPDQGASSHWMPYVLVEDVEASTKKAESLGAKVHRDVTEVPGEGRLSLIMDPTGAVLGLWELTSQ
jgi:hypothetical protein